MVRDRRAETFLAEVGVAEVRVGGEWGWGGGSWRRKRKEGDGLGGAGDWGRGTVDCRLQTR